MREILQAEGPGMRVQGMALDCLRESTEAYLVHLFEDASIACFHRNRVTAGVIDIRLVQLIRGPADPGRRM